MTTYAKLRSNMKINKINRVFKVMVLGNSYNTDCMMQNEVYNIMPTPQDAHKLYEMLHLMYQIIFEEYDQFDINDLIDTLTDRTRFVFMKQIKNTIKEWKNKGLMNSSYTGWIWLDDVIKHIEELNKTAKYVYIDDDAGDALDEDYENDEDILKSLL